MKFRRTGSTSIAALVAAGACALLLVAVIGSAQAAATKKVYDATVHVTGGAVTNNSATLTLTLKNDATSNQTLGSANFTAPAGITLGVAGPTDVTGWTATAAGSDVQFRSTSNALAKGQSVSANVAVTIDQQTCSNATWTTRAKQSNDFSGSPGNDFALNLSASNLVPLGSFTIEDIGTVVDNQFVPQIYVSQTKTVTVHAFDLCGEADSGYGTGAPGNFGDASSLSVHPDSPARLVGAGLPKAIAWPAGTASMKPVVVETADRVDATDSVSGIDATSNYFDVVEKICTSSSSDAGCHWDNGNNKIHVDAPAPPTGASLGIGFNSTQNFSCDSATSPLGATLIYIAPHDYEPGETQSVSFTYDKSIPGTSGPTSAFRVCLSKNNGVDWIGPIADCPTDPPTIDDAPCVQDRRRSNGNLVITLFFDPNGDPLGGIT